MTEAFMGGSILLFLILGFMWIVISEMKK